MDQTTSGRKRCSIAVIIVIIVIVLIIIFIVSTRSNHRRGRSSGDRGFGNGGHHAIEDANDPRFLSQGSNAGTCGGSQNRYLREVSSSEFANRIPVFAEFKHLVGRGSGSIRNSHLLPGPKLMASKGHKKSESSSSDSSSSSSSSSTISYHHHDRRHHEKKKAPSPKKQEKRGYSPESCDHSPEEKCEKCKDGGLGANCRISNDCACGLACQGGECVCPKPPPPQLTVQLSNTNDLVVTWPPVPGADYYDLYLVNSLGNIVSIQLFFVGTVITFPNLPEGVYNVFAFSGSEQCGMLAQFSQSVGVSIGSCTTNTDCPLNKPICDAGVCLQCVTNEDCGGNLICTNNQCTSPQCTIDSNCPLGQYCTGGNCTAGCVNALNCPTGDLCQNGTCTHVQCLSVTDCTAGQICSNNNCVCPTPAITGVTVSGSWPSSIQFTFQVTGATGNDTFTVPWQALGSTGQVAVSGYSSGLLSNGLYPDTPTVNFPDNNISSVCPDQPCCANFQFGCPQSGCGGSPTPNIVFKFVDVTVTNACGNTSTPTCWTFSSLCPGGPTAGVQVAC